MKKDCLFELLKNLDTAIEGQKKVVNDIDSKLQELHCSSIFENNFLLNLENLKKILLYNLIEEEKENEN